MTFNLTRKLEMAIFHLLAKHFDQVTIYCSAFGLTNGEKNDVERIAITKWQ